MDEKKQTEQTPTDAGDGDKSKAINLYEQTNQATERLEQANAKTEELLNRQEELYMKQKLGGGSEAGISQEPEMSEEEKASKARIKAIGKATGARWAQDE